MPTKFILVWLITAFCHCPAFASLERYDQAIADDATNAGLVPTATLTNALVFTNGPGTPFDFGTVNGAGSIEFIVEGDPVASGASGVFAVGENTLSHLRYVQWNNTGQLGFTQLGVTDYLFNPVTPAPSDPTHVVYVWDGAGRMELYLDGMFAGERSGVSGAFGMPSGSGRLGSNSGGGEGIVATIHRVSVYNGALAPAVILRHAEAYFDIFHPPTIQSFTATPSAFFSPGQSILNWVVDEADTVFIDGSNVTALSEWIVTPTNDTTYTLIATNNVGAATGTVSVSVNPAPNILHFDSTPQLIPSGDSADLSWATSFGSSWVISPGVGSVSSNGTQAVSPGASAVYTLSVSNAFGMATATQAVQVLTPATHLVISEFVADNESGITDIEGARADWIEIYNPSDAAIELLGYGLSDRADHLTSWRFPMISLPSEGRIVVFASGKNRTNALEQLHTDFRLDRNGEYLTLLAPGGTNAVHVFTPAFPALAADVSYGILYGDPSYELFMGNPTPGAINDPTPPRPDPVGITPAGGTFTNNSLAITLSSDHPIYFTTDGSEPSTSNGVLYTTPISIGETTRLRAVALFAGQLSTIASESYVRLAADLAAYHSDLPILVIENFGSGTIPAKGWSGNGSGVQQVARQPAMWATFDRNTTNGLASLNQEPEMISTIGIRGRGAFSSTWRQKPYSVEAWDEANDEREVSVLDMPAHSDWVLYYPDVDTNKDPTMLFNTFMLELSESMGRYASRFRWVEAFVNEDGGDLTLADYRGVYAIVEKVSRGKDRLDFDRMADDGSSGGFLLGLNRMDAIPVGGFPAENGADRPQFFHTAGPNRIVETIANAPSGGDDIPIQSNGFLNFDNPNGYRITTAQRAAIENWFTQFEDVLYDNNAWLDPETGYNAYIDKQDFVDYFIMHNLSHNGDGLLISMFPWRSSKDGKLRMGPAWDYNWSAFYISGSATRDAMWRSNRLWYGRLFSDPDFMQCYVDRWHALRETVLQNPFMHAIIDGQAAAIGSARAVLQGVPDASDWNTRQTTFKNWLSTRADWLDAQFVDAPIFTTAGGDVPSGFIPDFAANSATIYYTLDGSDPRAAGGGRAPNAINAQPGVALTNSQPVLARAFDGTAWSAPTETFYFVNTIPANSNNLVISAFHYRPADVNTNEMAHGFNDRDRFEFIELLNISTNTLNLSGVQFVRTNDAGITYTFSPRVLEPGARTLLVADQAAFEFRYGTNQADHIAGSYGGNLSNDGEQLTLLDANTNILVQFTYNDQTPWPEEADGDGFSLVLICPESNPDPASPLNWRSSLTDGGSPGTSDAISYASWKASYGIPTPEVNLDIDGDGRLNLVEYGQGTDPLVVESPTSTFTATIETLMVDGQTNAYFVLVARRNIAAGDITLHAELSDELTPWQVLPTILFNRQRGIGQDVEELRFRSLSPVSLQQRQYARLRFQLK